MTVVIIEGCPQYNPLLLWGLCRQAPGLGRFVLCEGEALLAGIEVPVGAFGAIGVCGLPADAPEAAEPPVQRPVVRELPAGPE